jgi:quercetin dioxygenase-like cupin family protein
MAKPPVIGRCGEGERLQIGPGAATLLTVSADSDGRLAVIEYEVAAGFPGPPLHIHPPFDEFFYVLDGELTFRLGEESAILDAGGYVYVPGGQPHAFANASSEPARMLVVAAPAGFEGFFRSVAQLTADGTMPSPETMARLNAEHGVEFV